ncbi:MAG TPA: hypothetical protein VGN25_01945 [Solirubrobacteraceae bacterium]|jgi:serine/threonine-protein kinase|nr:hypothetical protein [Solirubrobacteraceae bacterium]
MSPAPRQSPGARRRGTRLLRVALAGLAGVAAALLVSCGGSSKALIPSAHAGPLLSDFEAVRSAAENANGECSATEAALRKTEEDFNALPSTIDTGLRNNLRQGIDNLRVRSQELCAKTPTQSTATTTTTEKTTTTDTTPTTTTSTETQPTTTTTPPTTSTPTTTTPGGGTPAPGQGETPQGENEQGGGVGPGVGHNGGAGPPAPGQEAGK